MLKDNGKNALNVDDDKKSRNRKYFKTEIAWWNIPKFVLLHMFGIYGSFLVLSLQVKFLTVLSAFALGIFAGFGITAGAHRLWSHKTYKAKLPLKIMLMIFQTYAVQNDIYEWSRDHRVHHKFTDTDADPHNINRGFFFSHMGWLLMKKHPDVLYKGKLVDLSDLEQDRVVMFQRKYYMPLVLFFTFILPPFVANYLWNENFVIAFVVLVLARMMYGLNFTWCINSFAHIVGMKPFDKDISPTDNKITAIFTVGEGWHNYHHVFPWDYKTSELGDYRYNLTTAFIDLMAKIGWAYDLKTVPEEMIKKRVLRTGDGSHSYMQNSNSKLTDKNYIFYNDNNNINCKKTLNEKLVWGWDDKDMSESDKIDALTIKGFL